MTYFEVLAFWEVVLPKRLTSKAEAKDWRAVGSLLRLRGAAAVSMAISQCMLVFYEFFLVRGCIGHARNGAGQCWLSVRLHFCVLGARQPPGWCCSVGRPAQGVTDGGRRPSRAASGSFGLPVAVVEPSAKTLRVEGLGC